MQRATPRKRKRNSRKRLQSISNTRAPTTTSGFFTLKEDNRSKAKEEFSEAIQFDTNFAPGYVNLAKVAMSDKKFSEAENELNKAVSLDPTALNALALLTSAEYANEEYDKALATVNRIHGTPQHEQYGEVHLLAAEIYLKRNQHNKALPEFQLFLKECPEDRRVPEVKSLIVRLQAMNN
jgi:tetratricopeptide (TPR) repeat protein